MYLTIKAIHHIIFGNWGKQAVFCWSIASDLLRKRAFFTEKNYKNFICRKWLEESTDEKLGKRKTGQRIF